MINFGVNGIIGVVTYQMEIPAGILMGGGLSQEARGPLVAAQGGIGGGVGVPDPLEVFHRIGCNETVFIGECERGIFGAGAEGMIAGDLDGGLVNKIRRRLGERVFKLFVGIRVGIDSIAISVPHLPTIFPVGEEVFIPPVVVGVDLPTAIVRSAGVSVPGEELPGGRSGRAVGRRHDRHAHPVPVNRFQDQLIILRGIEERVSARLIRPVGKIGVGHIIPGQAPEGVLDILVHPGGFMGLVTPGPVEAAVSGTLEVIGAGGMHPDPAVGAFAVEKDAHPVHGDVGDGGPGRAGALVVNPEEGSRRHVRVSHEIHGAAGVVIGPDPEIDGGVFIILQVI